MRFIETSLAGAFVIEPELIEDERGFFARTFCWREFEARGLNPNLVQCSISFNRKRGTLRGMHVQVFPYGETKLVRCTAGLMYDVIIDLRPQSPAFKQWVAVELSAENRRALYIPEGCAHGFQTLADNTEVCYQISQFYVPECSKGLRFDDPAFEVKWPMAPSEISQRDAGYGLFKG